MSTHPIESLFSTTLENIQHMIDVSTVIGEPMETPGGLLIIPVSRVSFGFAVGGGNLSGLNGQNQGQNQGSSQNGQGDDSGFGGGSGAGVTVQPVAFLIIDDDEILFLPVDEDNPYLKLAQYLPETVEEIKNIFSPGGKDSEGQEVRA